MTKTDLFNKALHLIGHDRSITEGEADSVEYLRCQSEWDGARVLILQHHPWNALIQATPITVGAETTDDVTNKIEYSFDRPDCIKLCAVTDGSHRKVKYRVQNGIIYSETDQLIFEYIEDPAITADLPDEWPQALIDAMAAELASRIALSMTANAKVTAAMKQLSMTYLADAKASDAQEMQTSGSQGDRYINSRR